MKWNFKKLTTCFVLIGVGTLLGCASGRQVGLLRTNNTNEVDKSLGIPKDLLETYQVKSHPNSKKETKELESAEDKKSSEALEQAKKGAAPKEDEKSKEGSEKSSQKKAEKPSKDELEVAERIKKGKPPINNRFKGMLNPFRVGEKIVLSMSYFGVKAGTMTLKVMPHKVINSREAYHFRANLKSASLFDLFYRVDDYVESFVDKEGFFPYKLTMVLDESRQEKKAVEIFDYKKLTSHFYSWRKHIKKGVKEVKRSTKYPQQSMDMVSSFYYLRSFPLKVGDTVKFPVVSDGRVFMGTADVLREETINTDAGSFNCVVVKPITHFDGKMKKTGDIFLWFTNDERHHMVRIKAHIKIGALLADAIELVP